GLPLVPLLVLPLAPLEPSVDRHGTALREVVGAVLALRAPYGDVEVVGLVLPIAGGIAAAGVARDPQAAHGCATGGAAQLRVARASVAEASPNASAISSYERRRAAWSWVMVTTITSSAP